MENVKELKTSLNVCLKLKKDECEKTAKERLNGILELLGVIEPNISFSECAVKES